MKGRFFLNIGPLLGVLLLACWLLPLQSLQAQGLSITEFMARSDGSLLDEDGWHSDWIEIYNGSSQTVNLKGWGLSDKPKSLFRWVFPNRFLLPGTRLVVFASGRDRTPERGELHTNFKLSADAGQFLALTNPQGVIVSQYSSYPEQFYGVSYGRENDSGRLRYFQNPSPGAPNALGPRDGGPIFSDYSHSPALPERPEPGQPLTVEIRVENGEFELEDITLVWRLMWEPDERIMMERVEEETGALGAAPLYRATIDGSDFLPGQMLRWYITASDVEGHQTHWPLHQSSLYSPVYFGTVIAAEPPETLLPVIELFPQVPGMIGSSSGSRCGVFFKGEFYDNVLSQVAGTTTRGFSKRSLHLSFPKDHKLLLFEGQPRYSDLRLLSNLADKSKVRSFVAFDFFKRIGTPAQESYPVRVQSEGEFYGIYDLIEDGDSTWLERIGLDPEGALYKMKDRMEDASTANKKSRKWEDRSDLEALIAALDMKRPREERVKYICDHFDLPQIINYMAGSYIMNHADQGPKNYYLYCDSPNTGRWMMLPWDLDLTWGRYSAGGYVNMTIFYDMGLFWFLQTNGYYEALLRDSRLAEMFYCRLQALMDEELYVAGPLYPANCYAYEKMVATQALMDPPEISPNDLELDEAAWPFDDNAWPWPVKLTQTPQEELERIRTIYFPYRLAFLNDQLRAYRSRPSDPDYNRAIRIAEIHPSALSGGVGQSYVSLYNTGADSVDLTGWKLRGLAHFDFAPGTVLVPGDTLYVAGHLKPNGFPARTQFPCSNEGLLVVGPLGAMELEGSRELTLQNREGELIDSMSYGGEELGYYENLRITELMYAPEEQAGDMSGNLDDYAWIELTNCGSNGLDLEGVSITEGIHYVFGSHWLEPGQSVVLAKNEQAFRQRYPHYRQPLFSGYSQNLGRRWDTLLLFTPEGSLIEELTYFGSWYPETDRGGYTLQVVDPWAGAETMSEPENWSPSVVRGGSPGFFELLSPPHIFADTLQRQAGSISFRVAAPREFSVEKSADLRLWESVPFELDEDRVSIADEGNGFFYRLRTK
ncbi:MAG: CotH kinase family protein [Limisphaerales bacterium]|jgi:hypothetical protein|nr:CotH kinase family protein [Verrucomicrobiota bacterium]